MNSPSGAARYPWLDVAVLFEAGSAPETDFRLRLEIRLDGDLEVWREVAVSDTLGAEPVCFWPVGAPAGVLWTRYFVPFHRGFFRTGEVGTVYYRVYVYSAFTAELFATVEGEVFVDDAPASSVSDHTDVSSEEEDGPPEAMDPATGVATNADAATSGSPEVNAAPSPHVVAGPADDGDQASPAVANADHARLSNEREAAIFEWLSSAGRPPRAADRTTRSCLYRRP